MSEEKNAKTYLDVADLLVYQKLCQLHIEMCDISHEWPAEERYELGSQIRRSSNSSPAQLAEKNDDRHMKNKVEGVNRSRGEAAETIHHLFMAKLKGYIKNDVYLVYQERYRECIRMLNGLEKSLERYLPEKDRRWLVAEAANEYVAEEYLSQAGWPSSLNTEH
jgi:four helix bundle protein